MRPPPPTSTPFPYTTLFRSVGDSVTDDLQSWAEILRHVLTIARPDDDLTVVNAGLSAHTTAMVLRDRKSTRLNSSHMSISYAVFCLKKKTITRQVRPWSSLH